jgi:hypothetical protein
MTIHLSQIAFSKDLEVRDKRDSLIVSKKTFGTAALEERSTPYRAPRRNRRVDIVGVINDDRAGARHGVLQ